MAQSTAGGPLASIYESRIGDATNTNEVMGYWAFLAGVVLGVLGLLIYYMTAAATMSRGVGYALAALAPALLMAGAVLRFPLRKTATTLVGAGLALTVAAIVWFLIVFPGGWSLTTGNSAVIISYTTGLAIIGIGGSIVPLATDARDAARSAAEQRAETAEGAAEATRDDADATIRDLRDALADTEADEADLTRLADELRGGLADTEADEADLAAQLRSLRASQSRFELYEDRGEQWRWRLRHRNGNLIADSGEGYTRKYNAQNGVQAVRRDALGATVLLIEREDELPAETEEFDPVEEEPSRAEFELYEDNAGEHRWRIRHENGNIIADSAEGYASRGGAENAIDGIREYVGPAGYLRPAPTAIEVYRDQAGEWRWRLVHRNGNILADSGEGYSDRSGARRALDRIRERIDDMEVEVYEDQAEEYRWRLLGGNNQIMADSGEGYASRNGVEQAVENVQEHMPDADLLDLGRAVFEVYEDQSAEWRWRLRHRNGQILMDSGEGYSDRSGVWDAIESVKRNAPNAGLEETDS